MNHLSSQQTSPTPPSLTQQFCLRWHNHQTSLLTSLPLLLDQSHLTDVTLSAEGRTVRAHRVVLSACSSFFSELFRTLDPPFHPVIVIPGASFCSIVALLTFMYSGEVNVFEEQISTLLSLAETLGIKGLADINGNVAKNAAADNESTSSVPKQSQASTPAPQSPTTPSPPPTAVNSALVNSSGKFSLPLESMLAKTFQICPSMLTNPLNFSPNALNRSAELFSRYQAHCRMNQMDPKPHDPMSFDENGNSKNFLNIESKGRKSKLADTRKIDKIAENLRSSTKERNASMNDHHNDQINKHPLVAQSLAMPIPLDMKSTTNFNILPNRFGSAAMAMGNGDDFKTSADMSAGTSAANINDIGNSTNNSNALKSLAPTATTPTPPASNTNQKPANSKLYATCFICHKQLSNQYNLRVHLETHQNVRYACSVCSHVSRSKDALRKHVSYRHPGAPSPCDSESKRKRSRASISVAMMQSQIQQQQQQLQQKAEMASSPSSSSSSLVPSPVIIKNEIANDLSMNAGGASLSHMQHDQQSTSSYVHSSMGNIDSAANSTTSIQPPATSASACFLMHANIDSKRV